MTAAHHREVVADLPRWRIEGRLTLRASAELESASDVEQHVVRHVAVDVDAHFGCGEEISARTVNVEVVVRETELVQRRRADDEVLAERKRLREIVSTPA